jgi:hypothetical protein
MRATLAATGFRLFFSPYAPSFLISKNKWDRESCAMPVHAPIQVCTHHHGAARRLKD